MSKLNINNAIAQPIKKSIMAISLLLLLSLAGDDSPSYPIPDTDIYDNIRPPYILYVEGAPGVCQYWFYDTDGTTIPLMKHQIDNNQYGGILIYQREYRRLR